MIKEYGNVIADDLWIMYTLTINELKIAKEFGRTNVLKVYEIARTEDILREVFDKFKELYNKGTRRGLSFEEYINELNEVINKFSNTILDAFNKRGEELKLLESNDIIKAYGYLRYICTAILSLYLTLEIMDDKNFSKCRLGELRNDETNIAIPLNKWLKHEE